MNLVLTGVSGFLGRQLVSRLNRLDNRVLLAGRDIDVLSRLFPVIKTARYEELTVKAKGFDVLIHLAVLNNNIEAADKDFFEVNVDFARRIAEDARDAGVPVFLNFCSFHALEDGPDTPYARSKRAGVEALNSVEGIKVINLFLPAVHGDCNAGKLAVLDKFPDFLRKTAFGILSAFAPTVYIDRIADFITQDLNKVSSEEPVFLADQKDENVVYRLGRKLLDYGFALSVILLFWWVLLIVWVLVKTGSEGPGIFVQDRVGKGGKVFTCYKFRTMGKDTRQAGTHEVSESAVTPFGAFLRKTKIDELPQVWNILKGELSLIGPRPCLPVQEELVAERTKRGVLEVLPGITGLAQIQGIDMSDPVRLARKDAEYIARRGLLFDIKIVFRTFLGQGQGDRTSK
ncbi:MAG: sugar transferase [Hyphomicrobiales bacterium]